MCTIGNLQDDVEQHFEHTTFRICNLLNRQSFVNLTFEHVKS